MLGALFGPDDAETKSRGSCEEKTVWRGASGAGANVQMLRAREIVVAGVAAVNDADQPTPEECREVAEQLMQMAEHARLPEITVDLLYLAERFERMAVLFEVNTGSRGPRQN